MIGAFQGHADEADGDGTGRGLEALQPYRWKDGRSVGLNDIGRKIAEMRAAERLDRARGPRLELRATARRHSLQLVGAAVEFVIADRVELEPQQVHRVDGRLIEIVG